ncbi:MAG: hypothetical protein IJU03_10270 [Thermoguttaceae bacterium]|nr:hypothetical protein [Thermoguttaceae bacterium]
MTNYILVYGTEEQIEKYYRIKKDRKSAFHEDVETAIVQLINTIADECRVYHLHVTSEQTIDAINKALCIVYAPEKRIDNPHDCVDVLFDVRSMRAFDPDGMSGLDLLDCVAFSPRVIRFHVWTFEAKIEHIGGGEIYRQERHLH